MPSLRSHLMRWLVRHVVRPKFLRAGTSIAAYRDMDRWISRNQRVPKGTEVQPIRAGDVPAEWVRGPGDESHAAILYLHGGGFIMGSPATHRELAARLSAVTHATALVLDYRLAPEHPFPAAMHDTIAAYRWLLEQGYTPDRLVMAGDSSGGGLALQALLALRDEGAALPAAAVLMSPVTDMVHLDGESFVTRADVDPMMTPEMSRRNLPLYVGDNDPANPLLCPVRADLSGLPPLCIHVGDHEILLSDSERLATRARAAGVEVEFKIWPGMWHVFQAAAAYIPEARQSLTEIARFVTRHAG